MLPHPDIKLPILRSVFSTARLDDSSERLSISVALIVMRLGINNVQWQRADMDMRG